MFLLATSSVLIFVIIVARFGGLARNFRYILLGLAEQPTKNAT
jgi:hypothetical protein